MEKFSERLFVKENKEIHIYLLLSFVLYFISVFVPKFFMTVVEGEKLWVEEQLLQLLLLAFCFAFIKKKPELRKSLSFPLLACGVILYIAYILGFFHLVKATDLAKPAFDNALIRTLLFFRKTKYINFYHLGFLLIGVIFFAHLFLVHTFFKISKKTFLFYIVFVGLVFIAYRLQLPFILWPLFLFCIFYIKERYHKHLVLLLSIIYISQELNEFVWPYFSRNVAKVNLLILELCGLETVSSFNSLRPIIGTNLFEVRIAPSCSGIEGLLAFILAFTVMAFWNKFHKVRLGFMFIIGITAMYIINILRVLILIFAGHFFSNKLVMSIWHSYGAFFLYAVVLLFMLTKATIWCEFREEEAKAFAKKKRSARFRMYVEYFKKTLIDIIRFPLDILLLWIHAIAVNIMKTKLFRLTFKRTCRYLHGKYCAPSRFFRNPYLLRTVCKNVNPKDLDDMGCSQCSASGKLPFYVLRSFLTFCITSAIFFSFIGGYYLVRAHKMRKKGLERSYSYKQKKIDVFMKAGDEFYKKREYKKATKEYKRVLELDIRNAKAYAALGAIFEKQRALQKAVKFYGTACVLDKKLFQARVNLARILLENNVIEKAFIYAKEAYNLHKNSLSQGVLIACYIGKGDITKARKLLAEIPIRERDNALLVYSQGVIHLIDKEREKAKQCFEKIKNDPRMQMFINIRLAKIYAEEKKYSKAEKLFKKVLRNSQNEAIVYELLALYFLSNQHKKAMAYYKSMYKKIEKNVAALENTALLLLQYKKFDEALKLAQDALERFKENAVFHLVIAKVYLRYKLSAGAKKYCEKAIVFSKKAKRKPLLLQAYETMGKLCFIAKKYDDAEQYFYILVKDSPKYLLGYLQLGATYIAKKNYEKALKTYKKALTMVPEKKELHLYIAQVYFAMENWRMAGKTIKKLLKVNPKSFSANNFLAILYENIGKTNKAESIYKKLIKLYPHRAAVAYNNLANIFEKEGKYKKALIYAARACAISNNKHPLMLDTLAWLLHKNGKTEQAKNILQRLIKFIPSQVAVRYHYGVVLMNLGDKTALSELEKALKLDTNKRFTLDITKRIKQLKSQ